MTTRRAELGELESLVMLAVLRLEDHATARGIREEVANRGGRELSRGATYATLSRLERKGLLALSPTDSASAPEKSRRRRFQLTPQGLSTLRTVQRHQFKMRAGLESILELPS